MHSSQWNKKKNQYDHVTKAGTALTQCPALEQDLLRFITVTATATEQNEHQSWPTGHQEEDCISLNVVLNLRLH